MKKPVEYCQELTPEDRIDVSFVKDRGTIIRFKLNYSALINSRWRQIMRIDDCHGKLHMHVYHLQGEEYWIRLKGDNNTVFTASKIHMTKNFRGIKENYIQSK